MDPTWLAAGITVCVASIIQTATGAGLGLIAGPALLLAMGSSQAVHVAVLLNLALSLALLPGERTEVPRAHFQWLTVGALIGLPLGAWLLRSVELDTLKLLAGAAVTAGGLQILIGTRRLAARSPPRAMTVFGVASGAMTAALAIPGPSLKKRRNFS